MAQDSFFIAARLHHGFFLLRQVPFALNMFKGELLSGAYAFFITPERNIVEIAVCLVPKTRQTKQGAIFAH